MAAPSIYNNELFLSQYNQDIDQAIARVQSGDYTTQEDLEKEMKEW